MGKKSRRKMLGESYKQMRKQIHEWVDTQQTIDEDDRMILKMITPTKLHVIPKDGVHLKELQIEFIKKMDTPRYRRFYNNFDIWIDEEKNVLVLSK